ncbi:MAG: hypothetical protein MUO62_08855 [Anaerolineales bacterium]|nr:hypothetical protein [Anaerolineales bacterium]
MLETIYFPDCKDSILVSDDGPAPQVLFEKGKIKLVVAGLKAGQSIPPHEETLGIYHFIEGRGIMTVDEVQYDVRQGTTIIVPKGAIRGISAKTDLSFLATRITPCHKDEEGHREGDCDQE